MRLDAPTDAAGFARRGAASDARHDYDAAIADLTRACELAPTESGYFYQRGMAHWHKGQQDAALGDFDQAIKLKPDNVDALLSRASLRADRNGTAAEVTPDLEAASRALPQQAELRLHIGALYDSVDQPAAAATEYTKWIDSHPRDDRLMPGALNSRCWCRALSGQQLDQALSDCNAALKMRPNTAAFLDSRGLVFLRQGNYDKAIADYDAALRLQPKIAWSLYGRGLAKSRKGMSAEGQADIAAATALEPKIAERAASFGISR
jgi:tetratricopeptide (TPR) repeat protein